jgi:hypothetical protein
MNHPLLTFLAEGLIKEGYAALRLNFPYWEMCRKVPDNQVILYLAGHAHYRPNRIIAAGKSLGERIASQMASEGMLEVGRLIFLGYPLHPPGKKDRPRDIHLYRIGVPMLFFSGTRDPFCDLPLLRQLLTKLGAPWQLEVIDGGDHSFNVPKSYAREQTEVYDRLLRRTLQWLKE